MTLSVGIILGSKSDLKTIEPCRSTLQEFGISCELRVCSAHRAPNDLLALIKDMDKKGVQIFVAAAGAAAHLPGVVASHTTKPVIGIPVAATALQGQDALYSIVQMPGGMPVACMAIGEAGAKNAALFAAEVLALSTPELAQKLTEHRQKMRQKVLADDKSLQGS